MYTGTFRNRHAQLVELNVYCSATSVMHVQNMNIATSNNDDNLFAQLRTSTLQFDVVTDDIQLYKGLFNDAPCEVLVDGVKIFVGRILTIDNAQAYNYSREVLQFTAVDNIALLSSVVETRQTTMTIGDYIFECVGAFAYVEACRAIVQNESNSLLTATISLRNWVTSDDVIVYKADILRDILSYMNTSLYHIDNQYVIMNITSLHNQSLNSITYDGVNYGTKILNFNQLEFNGDTIARAETSVEYRSAVNSITMQCDFVALDDVINEVNDENNENDITYFSGYTKKVWPTAPWNFMTRSGWEALATDDNLDDEEKKTGYIPTEFTFDKAVADAVYAQNYYSSSSMNDKLFSKTYIDEHSLAINKMTYEQKVQALNNYHIEYQRVGVSNKNVHYYRLFNRADLQTSAQTYTLNQLYEMRLSSLQSMSYEEFCTHLANNANVNCVTLDGVDYSVICSFFIDYANNPVAYAYNDVQGTPSFNNALILSGLYKHSYLVDELSAAMITANNNNKFVYYSRTIDCSKLPKTAKNWYLMFSGDYRFNLNPCSVTRSTAMSQIDNTDVIKKGQGVFNLVLHFNGYDDYRVNNLRVDTIVDKNGDQLVHTIASTTSWSMGIADDGYAVSLDMLKPAKNKTEREAWHEQLTHLTAIDVEYVHEPYMESLYFNIRRGKTSTFYAVANVMSIETDIDIKLAEGWLKDEEEEQEEVVEEDKDNSTSIVYYWRNSGARAGGQDITLHNKLVTYDETKMQTISSPWLGAQAVKLVRDMTNNYHAKTAVSEAFRFANLINQYGVNRLCATMSMKGYVNELTIVRYNSLSDKRFCIISKEYDVVEDYTRVFAEELNDVFDDFNIEG